MEASHIQETNESKHLWNLWFCYCNHCSTNKCCNRKVENVPWRLYCSLLLCFHTLYFPHRNCFHFFPISFFLKSFLVSNTSRGTEVMFKGELRICGWKFPFFPAKMGACVWFLFLIVKGMLQLSGSQSLSSCPPPPHSTARRLSCLSLKPIS